MTLLDSILDYFLPSAMSLTARLRRLLIDAIRPVGMTTKLRLTIRRDERTILEGVYDNITNAKLKAESVRVSELLGRWESSFRDYSLPRPL